MNLSAKIITTDEMPETYTDLHPHPEFYGECEVTTKHDDLFLRTQPTTDSEVITSLKKGSSFFSFGLFDSSLKWVLGQAKLPTGEMVAGFAYIQYLTLKEKETK